MSKVFVVGGGASGLVAAIQAKKNGSDVTILERNNILGKKILLTGNGRCNYYNDDQSINHYHSYNNILLENVINDDNTNKVLKFFDSLGIIPKIKDGYYYPYSNQAISIKSVLESEVVSLGIKIVYNCYVTNIVKDNDKFIIYSNSQKFIGDKVILATGAKSYPKTGSDGNGYALAKSFGHTIKDVLPSLVKLKGRDNFYSIWNGIRCNVIVSLYEDGIKVKEESGEIQLTKDGISGICVFNLSGIVAKGLKNNKSEIVHIDFIPFVNYNSKDDLINYFEERNNLLINRNISELLDSLLNYKLTNLILDLCNIDIKSRWQDLSLNDKRLFVDKLSDFSVSIIDTDDISNAQVCSGGVSLDEVNLNTMESLLVKGLYFTGELLDVDGDCGGYNLTFAWISGLLAGDNID